MTTTTRFETVLDRVGGLFLLAIGVLTGGALAIIGA
jgi:hypothetical protein